MKFLLRNFLWILIIIGGASYFLFFQKKPCESPIQYSIGAFDTEFGISEKDFLSALNTATLIWEKPLGKDLFQYIPNKGSLTVNLKYDSRQEITQQNQVLKADVAKTNKLALSIKEQFLSLESTLKIAQQDYKNAVAQYTQHQNDYNAQVQHWNSVGGAPKNEFNKLNSDKANLSAEYQALENKRLALNGLVNQVNDFINKYNLLVKDANSTISTINKNAGQEFEEGIYNPNGNEIDIYQFDGKQKLIRALAHELGHALGIDHNSNPASIMYPLNQSSTEVLSADDIKDLKVKCEIE